MLVCNLLIGGGLNRVANRNKIGAYLQKKEKLVPYNRIIFNISSLNESIQIILADPGPVFIALAYVRT